MPLTCQCLHDALLQIFFFFPRQRGWRVCLKAHLVVLVVRIVVCHLQLDFILPFSRHGIVKANFTLHIWLNENVLFLYDKKNALM